MAEITQLESKIGEVLGLAQAAQQATRKVAKLPDADAELKQLLDRMRTEAAETEKRCKAVAEKRTGKKTAINKKARETKTEAQEMMEAYLGDGGDALDGLEFLIMAEAGATPGEVVAIDGDRLVVAAADGAIAVSEIRADGEKVPAADYARRAGLEPGARLGSRG